MTAKRAISLTDQGYEYARSLVEQGKIASLSAVLRHGLTSLQREEQEHELGVDIRVIPCSLKDVEKRLKRNFQSDSKSVFVMNVDS
ncbi:MAG: hypothetical protein Alpg2KO_25180 [Alphaproteobacteria bacterium]